jgi:hypothetical protein
MYSSIREFGFKVPVFARRDGEVVDGHLRPKAARKLGSWHGGDTTAVMLGREACGARPLSGKLPRPQLWRSSYVHSFAAFRCCPDPKH